MRYLKPVFLLFFITMNFVLFAQDSLYTVVAKPGDGIFSLLRRSGIHPVNYYSSFLDLNAENIRNASELIVGKTYFLPNAPDSFRNSGRYIEVDTGKDMPLFEHELAALSFRDTILNNTVIYLIHAVNTAIATGNPKLNAQIKDLARNLMQRGATVYILGNTTGPLKCTSEDKGLLGDYVSVVNKKFLHYNGKYQRVLIFKDDLKTPGNYRVSVNYYKKDKKGEELAEHLQHIFEKNTSAKITAGQKMETSLDAMGLYLSHNLLPPVLTLTITSQSDPNTYNFELNSGKTKLSEFIAQGILLDVGSVTAKR